MERYMETQIKTRKPRSDRGPKITDRDLDALEWIAQQYAISLDHLCILLARLADPDDRSPKEPGRLTEKRATAIVRRWETLGLIQKAWILYNEPPWLWLTQEGLRLVAEQLGELRHYIPTPATINHLYFCNHTRLFVEHRRQDAVWTGERILKAQMQKVERGSRRPHMPDAQVWTNKRLIAVEVEISVKRAGQLDKILHDLALRYQTIWYFTHGTATRAIKQAVAAMREMYSQKFVVYDLDEIP
jgi:hypothetical protein